MFRIFLGTFHWYFPFGLLAISCSGTCVTTTLLIITEFFLDRYNTTDQV